MGPSPASPWRGNAPLMHAVPGWTAVVGLSRGSKLFTLGFVGACVAGAYYAAGATMEATNPGGAPRNEEFLRKKYGGSVQHQMHAKAQRASLQALLDDARSKGNPGRYSKALEGEVQGSLSDGARKFSRS